MKSGELMWLKCTLAIEDTGKLLNVILFLWGVNDSKEQQPNLSPEQYQQQVKQAYSDAAKDYLQDFSDRAFASLQEYEPVAEKAINAPPTRTSLEVEKLENQLALLNNLSENTYRELESLNAS